MVNIDGRFCIDRYENTLVDDATGQALSPHYPPEPAVAERMFDKWEAERLAASSSEMGGMLLPALPSIERTKTFAPRAVCRRGVLPQGYTSGKVAAEACGRANKRLCSRAEWVLACRGERQTRFPYGNDYRPGVCNVFRSEHPAQILHENPSVGHSDPRLGLVQGRDGPLLRQTGSTRKCASRWGGDAVFDMVGNVDEWIDDPDGTFVGGFFSRATKEGCDAVVSTHPYTYWDYSTGVRCCRF
jgi:formylglycine-generating enzyme